MQKRSNEEILAERRENALELHRERDPIARALLEFHISSLDRELATQGGLPIC
jgi:hypothetical protein